MTFLDFLKSGARSIAEGAVLERVRRDGRVQLDPQILNSGLIYDPVGRQVLAAIHRDYMSLAREAGLPLLTFTDTWRCSNTAVEASAFKGHCLNEDHVAFLKELRAEFGDGPAIFIGGLVGPSADAYRPQDGLSRAEAREFHRLQIEALASSGVDFLHLATAPNVEEALGIADVMAQTDLPFIISFVIRRTGHVLDGTPLVDAMQRMDEEVTRKPDGFSVNCVHAAALESALEKVVQQNPSAIGRLLAFQANTADCEVEDLDGSDELITQDPQPFATQVMGLQQRFCLRVLGGCCGTDGAHMRALARMVCEG